MIYGIEKILMICHHTHKDRLQFQKQQFQLYDLVFEKIDTVKVLDPIGFSNKPVKSCFLSHIKALEFASKISGNCLILEDDICIDNIELIDQFMQEILSNDLYWDMIYFYPSGCPGNNTTTISSNITKNTKIVNAHAYIVNPKIIDSLLAQLYSYVKHIEAIDNKETVKSHYDHVLMNNFHDNMNIYSPNTHLIFQYRKKFGSSLDWGFEFEDQKFPSAIE